MKVAYIGLGSMGGDQARQIAKSDIDLTVFDLFEGARDKFRDIANVAESLPEAVKGADVIHVCVRDAAQVEDVLFGEGKVTRSAKPGALIVVHSTVDVATCHALDEKLKNLGFVFAEAPVTRTSLDEDGRFVLTMFGGDAVSFNLALPILQTFSTDVLHVGGTGAAMALKIANNMMTWAQLVVGDLVFQLAESHGVSFEHLQKVTKANGNLTMVTEAFLGGARANPESLTQEHIEFITSQAGIGEKDLALAIEASEASGIDTRIAEVARELLRPVMCSNFK